VSLSLLIVDDGALARHVLKHLMSREGFATVVGAGSVAEALAAARVVRPDAILVDTTDEGVDGPDLIAALSKLCPDARIAAVIPGDDTRAAAAARHAGAEFTCDAPGAAPVVAELLSALQAAPVAL